MAATVIDAIAIPRLNAGLSRRAAAPISAASGRRGALPLVPASRGLRIARPPTRSSAPAIARVASRRRAVVCEAQETTIEGGACGYDNTFHAGFGINTAALSGALFRSGEACGACFRVMCDARADPKWCHPRATVTLTATNFCPSNNNGGWCNPPRAHFDMSLPAFSVIARVGSEGIVPVLYRRVACKRSGGVRFTLKGQSSFNLVMFSNVGGSGDVRAAWIKGSRSPTWKAMQRNWGANWQTNADLRNQGLSFRLMLGDGKTLEFAGVVPPTWRSGETFASQNQFI